MEGQHILQNITPKVTKKNSFLMLALLGLIVAEDFVKKDFVCPCENSFRIIFFTFYLAIPTFIIFSITFCVMCELVKQETNKEAEIREKIGQCSFILRCAIPCVFWLLLFFSDGRYVACLVTELKDGHVDSSPLPLWEWCDKNRTMTRKQKRAELSYYASKVVGFSALFIASFVLLVYKCCNDRKPSNPENVEQRQPLRTRPNSP